MSRPVELTDEERRQRRRENSERQITIAPKPADKNKLMEFSKQYKSLNCCILDLIKTHPDFKKFKFDSSKCSIIV